jgi:hypothetical protein
MAVSAARKPAMGVAMTHKSHAGEVDNKEAKGADEISIESGKSTPGR